MILIVITVAAGVIIYYFVSGYLSSTTSSAANQETYVITSVIYFIKSGSPYLNATVYNSGATNINIVSANVLNATGGIIARNNSAIKGLVPPGQTVIVNILLNTTLTKGFTYTLLLVTAQGTQQTFTFRA